MKVLLIGSGGREHALAWKLIQSPACTQLICAPGNAGISEIADCINIQPDDLDRLIHFVKEEGIRFVVVGPEVPLAMGLVDRLVEIGVATFGPRQAAARLEYSKAFTKDFCRRHNIPTAAYDVFTDLSEAKAHLDSFQPPYVIKADGLAAGKGVVIAQTRSEAESELEDFFSGKFGAASDCVVIEEFLQGYEISYFAISDGDTLLPLCEAQDHKRAYDGDKGPNTGGMGAYSPVPQFDDDLEQRIITEILEPTVKGMTRENYPFVGVLFAGLMITESGPKLIEYNVRFGDPECQVLMRRLDSDLLDIMVAACAGTLDQLAPVEWNDDSIVNVVMAADGYPGAYSKGSEIKGVDAANLMDGIIVFHAGTKRAANGKLLANGGRVLNITAKGESTEVARKHAYEAIDDTIDWPQGFCRRDIAANL